MQSNSKSTTYRQPSTALYLPVFPPGATGRASLCRADFLFGFYSQAHSSIRVRERVVRDA
jgi:hypothetical protein